MSQIDVGYMLSETTELPLSEAVARVRDELAHEGFGVLAEIDVRATLRARLGISREPYLILEAPNQQLARALEAEPARRSAPVQWRRL